MLTDIAQGLKKSFFQKVAELLPSRLPEEPRWCRCLIRSAEVSRWSAQNARLQVDCAFVRGDKVAFCHKTLTSAKWHEING